MLEPGRADRDYWREVWRFRELFWFLSWRDILVRYKQTVIGVAWGVIRPLLTMAVFTVIFGRIGKFPSEGVPYPVLVFAAMLPWQFFASALSESSGSMVKNAGMLSKIYFPRLVIPASSVLVALVDFAISFALLILLMVFYGFIPSWRMAALPLFLALALVASLGAGFWLSALSVKYRDFRYVIPFVVQFGLYVSPVGFSTTVVPEQWRLLYSLNPMVGVIEGFRWAILGRPLAVDMTGFLLSIGMTVALFVYGLHYFRKMERTFADVI